MNPRLSLYTSLAPSLHRLHSHRLKTCIMVSGMDLMDWINNCLRGDVCASTSRVYRACLRNNYSGGSLGSNPYRTARSILWDRSMVVWWRRNRYRRSRTWCRSDSLRGMQMDEWARRTFASQTTRTESRGGAMGVTDSERRVCSVLEGWVHRWIDRGPWQ